MKKILLLLVLFSSFQCFSQRVQNQKPAQINWINLQKAKEYAAKYDKNILIYFYKKDCPYCDQMKEETLKNKKVVDLINRSFLPVKINSRTKDTIYYNGKAYGNKQPIEHNHKGIKPFPHDFYLEVASYTRKDKDGNETTNRTTPTVVLFNKNFEKITEFPGLQKELLFLRRLKPYTIKN